jgi:hypothetical protein
VTKGQIFVDAQLRIVHRNLVEQDYVLLVELGFYPKEFTVKDRIEPWWVRDADNS